MYTQARQVMPALRSQGADPAKWDADGADVGKSAQSEARDHDRTIDEQVVFLEVAEVLEGDELVQDGARAQQIADALAVFPGDAQHVGHGRHRPTDDALKRQPN